jgi:hypothetical protein
MRRTDYTVAVIEEGYSGIFVAMSVAAADRWPIRADGDVHGRGRNVEIAIEHYCREFRRTMKFPGGAWPIPSGAVIGHSGGCVCRPGL